MCSALHPERENTSSTLLKIGQDRSDFLKVWKRLKKCVTLRIFGQLGLIYYSEMLDKYEPETALPNI